jgi:hypothetical protein
MALPTRRRPTPRGNDGCVHSTTLPRNAKPPRLASQGSDQDTDFNECTGATMFVEQRLYTFAPGKGAEFNKIYEAEGRAPQERHLGAPVGYYYSEIGPLNQVMTLWAYATLNERVERRERLFRDPEWISFLQKARPLLVTQETRILTPATFFQERLKSIVEMGRTR